MESGSIGIKLANNTFFPIMAAGAEGNKTLELTTVRENQTSVQIDLYRSKSDSPDQTLDNAEYIGTLCIEDISEKPAGDPTIGLKIKVNEENELSAEAVDLDSGSKQSLNVSLKTLDKSSFTDLPDFDIMFDHKEAEPLDFTIETDDPSGADDGLDNIDFDSLEGGNQFQKEREETFSTAAEKPDENENLFFDPPQNTAVPAGLYDSAENDRAKERKGVFMPAWLCVLILVVGIAALALALIFAWKLFFSGDSDAARKQPAVERTNEQPESGGRSEPSPAAPAESAGATEPESEPGSVGTAETARETEPTPPPVSEREVVVEETEPLPPREPEPVPKSENVFYRIKWGDTLWDLAETYYRDPWKYSYIARYNDIKNPNLIIAGRYLVIPAE